jgi:tetratricopeptide (TPR) repeat protein
MMIETDNRPELIAYRKALEMAWLDGVITYDEAKILDTLRDYLHISEEVHWEMENEIKATIPNPGIKEYKMALEQVWMDGLLTDEEKKMLKKLQIKYKISDQIHTELEMKVKADLGITNQESEIYFPEKVITENENHLLDQDPSDKDAELYWINKGKKQWYISKQNIENGLEAIDFFDKAIEKNPKSFIAWIYKGCIYKKLNLPDKAIQCYDNAIELKNDFIASWYNKGMLLAQVSLNQIEEAIKCFDEVLKINPNHPLAIRDKEIFDKLSQICSTHQQKQDT